jgi:hypothetical protein
MRGLRTTQDPEHSPNAEERSFMRHNHRPVLLASTLPPDALTYHPGRQPRWSAECGDCGRVRLLRKSMLTPHHRDDAGKQRCPGSGTRIRVDLTPEQWRTRLLAWQANQRNAKRLADPNRRQPTRVHLQPGPPVPPPVFRIRRTAA